MQKCHLAFQYLKLLIFGIVLSQNNKPPVIFVTIALLFTLQEFQKPDICQIFFSISYVYNISCKSNSFIFLLVVFFGYFNSMLAAISIVILHYNNPIKKTQLYKMANFEPLFLVPSFGNSLRSCKACIFISFSWWLSNRLFQKCWFLSKHNHCCYDMFWHDL